MISNIIHNYESNSFYNVTWDVLGTLTELFHHSIPTTYFREFDFLVFA